MIERKIVVCTGTDVSKNVRIRLSLLIVEDGIILSEHYHSVGLEPGADLAMIRDAFETHLAQKDGGIPGAPWPSIPDDEWNEAVMHCGIVFTPKRIAEAKAKMEAAILKFGVKDGEPAS